jgi:hypothetical protein
MSRYLHATCTPACYWCSNTTLHFLLPCIGESSKWGIHVIDVEVSCIRAPAQHRISPLSMLQLFNCSFKLIYGKNSTRVGGLYLYDFNSRGIVHCFCSRIIYPLRLAVLLNIHCGLRIPVSAVVISNSVAKIITSLFNKRFQVQFIE